MPIHVDELTTVFVVAPVMILNCQANMSECMSTQPSIPTKRVGLLCRTVERGKSMWRAPQDY